jgi:hypothetical protein
MQDVTGGKVSIMGGHSIGHSKQKSVCVLFRTISEIQLFHCTVPKLLIRKRYYVLLLMLVFIIQVAKLVQFTECNAFSKISPSTSMHFGTHVRTWRVARLYSEIDLFRKVFEIGHMYIHKFCLEWPILLLPRILVFPSGTLCIYTCVNGRERDFIE